METTGTPPFRLTVESALYLALVGVALAVRLWGLGYQPLSDTEAHDALLAYHFLQVDDPRPEGEAAPAEGPASPLLFSLSALAFLLFGASDATARLAPALAGAGLVFTPLLFRRALGRLPALAMAALLALSPALIAASRMADAATLLALALLAALGSLLEYGATGDRRYLIAAAAGTGAALACGPRAVTALLGLALAFGLWRLLDGPGVAAWAARVWNNSSEGQAVGFPVSAGGLAAVGVGVLVAGSSALLLYRPGLAAAAQALPAWLAGWQAAPAGLGLLQVPAVLAIYEPLTLFLGFAGLLRLVAQWGEKDRPAWALAAWSLAALAVGVIYPGRSSADAVWTVIPLTGLAALFVVEYLADGWRELDAPAVGIHAGLVVLLMGYSALNLVAYGLAARSFSAGAAANLGLAGVALVLIALISLLFGVGWSAGGSVRGLALGLGAAFLFGSLSAVGRVVHWGEQPQLAAEVWNAGPPIPLTGLRLMQATLEDVSDRAVGDPNDLEVVVDGPPVGALAWALRDFHAAAYTDGLGAAIAAPVVIAPADEATPELGSAYVGQSFAVQGVLGTDTWGPAEWLGWLTFHRTATPAESVVLWVRADVQFQLDTALGQ